MNSRRWGHLILTSAVMLTMLGGASVFAETANTIRLLEDGNTSQVVQAERDSRGMTLELAVPVLEAKSTTLGGRDFDELSIPGAQMTGKPGQPALPVISQLVAIPNGLTLKVVGVQPRFHTLEGEFIPVPAQGLRSGNDQRVVLDDQVYSGDKALTASDRDMVRVGEPALLRGQRVVSVTFHPVTWDAGSKRIEAAAQLSATFEFVPSDDGNDARETGRPIPESFATMYANEVLGYEKVLGQESSLGTYLIIYPNTTGAFTAISPLIDWRERQGYNVKAVSTSQTGTSNAAIKNYIQDQYNNLEIPLEFVTLAGDATGSVSVASWRESESNYNGEGDHDYTMLEGNDVLADIHIGRLSVTSISELTTVVNKIVNYERDPHMGSDLGWFQRAGLTGDPGSSGYSTIWVNQWVKEQLEELNYTQIDTFWSGNFLNGMMGTINQGETIFTYRGYWHMSGMNTGHIASLSNGGKLPFAVVLTCDTGSFWDDTTCRSEAFLRAPNGGGIASIGTATIGTHTRYNNCMFQGVAEGVLNSGDPRVGPALTKGKLDMYSNYFDTEPNTVMVWSTWNNLMGDPATAIWTGVPSVLDVSYPASLSPGANAIPVTVTSGGQPVASARVALYMKDVVQVNGLTDENGQILFPVDGMNTGQLLVTVTGTNLKPHLGGINVGNQPVAVEFASQVITDDGSGNSFGNGDGMVNPGETVDVALQLLSSGTGGANDVTIGLVSPEAHVSVLQGAASFGYLGSGATGWGDQSLTLAIDSAAPAGRDFPVEMTITSGAETWTAVLPMTVHGAAAQVGDLTLSGVGDSKLDPGETGSLRVGLSNIGNLATSGVTATLSSNSQWVDVLDATGTFGAISAGGSASNTTDLFSVSAASDCYPGHLASFTLELEFAEGGTATTEFQLTVGQASSTDPVGPDGHGYYAFDNTDTSYDYAPTYDWVEIDPGLGGSGSSVGLTDYSRYNDDVRTINLPFDFDYYGKTFDKISICSNGWVSMGQTYVRHYRNWTIPSPGGPDNMIAVFWDDLYLQSGTGGVFYWHDVANNRFIIEWSQVRNYVNGVTETFQVMLYDPAHTTGDTGDGVIVAQYHTVNQVDWENGYATAGIQNEDRDDGLLYTYWNEYPGGGATLQAGRAIEYRTVEAQASGVLKGTVTNASGGGNAVDGATISILGSGRSFMTAVNGLYQGGVPIGTYDVAVSHAGFAPDTTFGVTIMEDMEHVVDFSLTDIAGPDFNMVTMPANTEDTTGPYNVGVEISDYTGLDEMHFYYTSSSTGGPYELPLVATGGQGYSVDIPGQPEDTRIQYWLTARDILGQSSSEPHAAPGVVHSFVVTGLSEIYAHDMETVDGWTGGISGDTASTGIWVLADPNGVYESSIEVQPEDDHTVAGSMCWITGNDPAGSNQGTNDVDGGLTTLESPTFNVSGMSGLQVSYYRWYTNDTGQNPGEDYWRVQASVGDGNWVNLEETTTSNRSWQYQSFLVEDYLAMSDNLEFRFLADDSGYGSVVEAGVDDFLLMGYNLPGDMDAPTVGLTSFTGGQTVVNGSNQEITWNHSDDIGVVNVDILLSYDSGSSWTTEVASGAFNQSYSWDVPMGYSNTCRLKVIVTDGAGHSTEAVSGSDFTIDSQTPVGDLPVNRLALGQNAPNPFNPKTEISFSLPSDQKVSLKIYNVEGRLVKTLVSGSRIAGSHQVFWSGNNDRGDRVASGLYFYRLTTDSGVLTRKMTLLK